MKSILLFLAVLHFSCSSKEEKVQVTVQDITESVYASGIVKSRNQYEVYSTVNGTIKKINVSEGEMVYKGQPLFSLVNETSRLTAENARITAAYSSIEANSEKIREARINIDLARSKMQNDSLLFTRQKNLWAEEIGTRNELDQRELAYKNSVNAYRASILRYNDLIKQLNLVAKQSQKNLEISSQMLDDYIVRSESNGRIFNILKEAGEMVNTQMPLAVIGDANDFILELQVDEYDIASIKTGQKVMVGMDSYKGQVFEAVIDRIIPIMNDRSRSFKIEAVFVKKPDALYPNLTVEANIILQTKPRAITIPRHYLLNDSTVIKENGDTVKVVTGIKDYQRVEILSGLSKEDWIIKPTE